MRAEYWCVWGCLDQHVTDAKLCLCCMVSKKSKVHGMTPYTRRMICWCSLMIREFYYVSVTDPKRTLMGESG